jgi:hypothetical protein
VQNRLRESEIVFHHVAAVVAGGVGARALMKNRFDPVGERVELDCAGELARLHEV